MDLPRNAYKHAIAAGTSASPIVCARWNDSVFGHPAKVDYSR